jgi:NarL family two-component system response regulator LiaR
MKRTVAIVEDDPDLRAILQQTIDSSGRYVCVGTYGRGEEALTELKRIRPSFVLMDILLPGISGLECVDRLKKVQPGMSFIMVSGKVLEDRIGETIASGADGFLRKPFTPTECIDALDTVAAGGVSLSPLAAKYLARDYRREYWERVSEKGITPREQEVLKLLERGKSHKEIASLLHVSESTVHSHLQSVYVKLGAHNGFEAIAKLRQI